MLALVPLCVPSVSPRANRFLFVRQGFRRESNGEIQSNERNKKCREKERNHPNKGERWVKQEKGRRRKILESLRRAVSLEMNHFQSKKTWTTKSTPFINRGMWSHLMSTEILVLHQIMIWSSRFLISRMTTMTMTTMMTAMTMTMTMRPSLKALLQKLQSSDEELPAEEEAEVLRLQREKAKSLRMEDFGLEDEDEDENESDSDGPVKTLQDAFVEKRTTEKFHADEVTDDGTVTAYEEIKKDLNALTKEEQMDVVYSSAPELVGLLSELNDALNELENKVNPLQSKVNKNKNVPKGGMLYVEVKRLLLLAYCQAISFYLLLKTEGHSVRDHPVIARLVEIKGMLDKVKQIDGTLPSQIDEILNHEHGIELEAEPAKENAALELELHLTNHKLPFVSVKKHEGAPASEIAELVKVSLSKDCESKDSKNKRQNDQVSLQSMEMLKVRERLEEKLKQKGLYGSVGQKNDRIRTHPLQLTSRPLETLDDFDGEVIDMAASRQASNKGDSSSLHLNKLSQLVSAKVKKPKLVSGDDDLPARDDIGERRRKYELQVLANAGAAAMDDIGDEDGVLGSAEADESMDIDEDGESNESEDDFYKQVKQQRAAKIAAKAEIYSKTPAVPSLPETVVDGKRQITYQMDKNRGLTRARKKLTKIPRKKYKLKHQKAVVRRKGQVRDIRKPSGPYGGEASGINTGISRSIRFKS